ncbi:MAG: hypothetical protein Fur0046_23870 [Cyanobacteria bacterium J069]|nr:MAG: hypothetical protein D6742_06025 [Cyanobacteria bacterium J069]
MTCILLQELDSSDLNWLMQSAMHMSIPSETILAEPDQPADQICFILEGMVAIASPVRQTVFAPSFVEPADSQSWSMTTLSQIPSGDLVSLHALLDSKPLPYAVISESQCQVLSIPRSLFLQKLQDDLSFAAHVYRTVAMLLSARNQRLVREFEYQNLTAGRSPLRQAITLFAELQDIDLDWLAAVGSVQTAAADEVVLSSGRSPDALHILLEGALLLSQPIEASNLVAQTLAPDVNPASPHREVARLSRGDLVGEMQMVNAHDLTLCASALRESQILSIPRWRLAAKLLHDVGFASRFYRVLASLLAAEYETMLHQLHSATVGATDERVGQMGDRDDLSSRLLTRLSLAEARFEWLLKRIQAQQETGRDLQW